MVGADVVEFMAHSPKMRGALGIVMRAPLVSFSLTAGSSPTKVKCIIWFVGFEATSFGNFSVMTNPPLNVKYAG